MFANKNQLCNFFSEIVPVARFFLDKSRLEEYFDQRFYSSAKFIGKKAILFFN